MMRRIALGMLVAGVALLGSGAIARPEKTPEQRLAEATRNGTPGTPVDCINQDFTQDGQTIPGVGIVYHIGRTFYVNRFEAGCDVRPTDFLVTETHITQLCRGDFARIVDSTTRSPRGGCVYGRFVPYAPAR